MGTKKNNISNVLFSKVQQRILAILFGKPDCAFYTNEIIRLTKSGTGAVQRELKKLTDAGLINVKQIGNQKHYQTNRASPLFPELHSIVLKTFGLADILRDTLQPISSQIHIAFVYGSIAKQEEKASSDIDLLILSNKLTYADMFHLLERAESKLNRPINPTIYSPTEWSKKLKENNNFLNQIIKQPKIFLIGNEDELGKFR